MKIVTNLHKKMNICACFLIFSCGLASQIFVHGQSAPVWHVEQKLTDIDDIDIENSTANYIIVHKNNLKGVKNIRNELVIPIQYKGILIFEEGKVISVFDGKQKLYFDFEGYAVSKETGEKAHSVWNANKKKEDREYTLNSGRLYSVRVNNYFAYINQNLDTILRLQDAKNPRLIGDKYYVTEAKGGKTTQVYDNLGKLHKTLEYPPYNISFHPKGYITNRFKDKAYLYDQDFNEIKTGPCSNIWVDDSLDVMIFQINKQFLITDLQQKPLLPDTFPVFPHIIKGKPLIIIPLQDKTITYNTITRKVITSSYVSIFNEKAGSHQVVRDTFQKRGIYDFEKNTLVIQPTYDHLTYREGYFIGRLGEKTSKHHEILNKSGSILYSGHYSVLQILQSGLVITDTLQNIVWYDNHGKKLKEFQSPAKVHFNTESQTVQIFKANEPSKTYFITDYLTSEKPVGYQAIGDRLNAGDKSSMPLFIVKNKDKFGIIDSKGKIVINPVFTSHASLFKDKWVVESNGKTGVLSIPKLPVY